MKLENEYENGDINIKDYLLDEEEDIHCYWLKVGMSLLELKEHHLYELYDLLEAWIDENPNRAGHPGLQGYTMKAILKDGSYDGR